MRISSGDRLLDRTFFISLLLKLADGIIELIGGALLLVVSPRQIQAAVAAVTRGELAEDPNDWLANLSGYMKGLFFMKGNSVAVQPELPGTEQSDMPALRMPEIGSIPWTKEYTGLRLVIDHGIGGASDIVVTDCKADNIVLTMKEGGSAEVEFKLKSNTADEHTRGQLTSTIKRDIEVRIFGPDVDEQQDIAPAPPPAARKRKDATDAFVEQHGSAS